ncbi:monocarboxylate transporter 3-like [Babylonia areolata]|uniref:monocarboxylate transporter 3-like n=1 Tax=Babylonia areolata TaxID=304850 RepID=UPI003FD0CB0C
MTMRADVQCVPRIPSRYEEQASVYVSGEHADHNTSHLAQRGMEEEEGRTETAKDQETDQQFSPLVVQGVEGENEGTEEVKLESDGVPYDRGWAWAVVFGCFVNYFFYSGYIKCYSLFYVELLHRFQADATHTALFFSIRSGFLSVGSLFVMNIVVGHVGVRKTVMMGGLLVSLSGILPSFCTDMMAIIWLQGTCLGLGQSMLVAPGEVLMGAYFRKRRTLALPVAKCGASVGSIVMPLLVSFLLTHYGLSGALLVMGGVCLHTLPAGLLLRPTSFFRKQQAASSSTPLTSQSTDVRPEAAQAIQQSREDEEGKSAQDGEKCRCRRCPKASSLMLDFSLFRRPLFLLLLSYFLLFNSVNIMTAYLPAMASENGMTDTQNGVLVSVMGVLDLVCRVLCAVVASTKVLTVPSMVIISYVILGVTSQFVRFLTSFPHFVALSVVLGLLGGVANAMLPMLVLHFVGLDSMAKALGFVLLVTGASSAASYPLLGYIRDLAGSYIPVYHVIGISAILAAGILCLENCVRRLENTAKNDSDV